MQKWTIEERNKAEQGFYRTKKFRVEHREDLNPDALDLVNIDDPNESYMCAEDEFTIGEIITEDEFELSEHSYVDDQSAGTALFAFKVGTYMIIRYRKDEGFAQEIIKKGLTLKEAQEHCQNPETKGDGWLDGYIKEE